MNLLLCTMRLEINTQVVPKLELYNLFKMKCFRVMCLCWCFSQWLELGSVGKRQCHIFLCANQFSKILIVI